MGNECREESGDDIPYEILHCKHKLDWFKPIIYIEQDKEGNNAYICVVDNRKPTYVENGDNQNIINCGDLDIFVLSKTIFPSQLKWKLQDMPYLQSTFNRNGSVSLLEIHTATDYRSYEGKGYAGMMINTLIAIAKESKCTKIGGKLSSVDATDKEKKEHRNRFYEHEGFQLTFDDDTHESGSFSLTL